MNRIVVRVDGGATVGSGHVVRCLTLGMRLRDMGADVTFLMRERAGGMRTRVESAGFDVRVLPQEAGVDATWLGAELADEITQCQAVLVEMRRPFVVVDHYGLDARWEGAMRHASAGIAVIDDLANRPHDCDVLLDTGLIESPEERYRALVPGACSLLMGPQYALLREQFRAPVGRARTRDGRVNRILVFYGGFDARNGTTHALEALAALSQGLEIDVILPPQAPHADVVRRRCRSIPGARFLGEVTEMAEAMERADLALGAGGTATWERAALGLPAILSVTADNQLVNVRSLHEAGASVAVSLETMAIRSALEELLQDAPRVARMAGRSRALAGGPGFGTDRVAQRIVEAAS